MSGGLPACILSHLRFRVFVVFGVVKLIRCNQWLLETHGFGIPMENSWYTWRSTVAVCSLTCSSFCPMQLICIVSTRWWFSLRKGGLLGWLGWVLAFLFEQRHFGWVVLSRGWFRTLRELWLTGGAKHLRILWEVWLVNLPPPLKPSVRK